MLDGLDECEKESLKQLFDALGNYFLKLEKIPRLSLKVVVLSCPQPAHLERKLGQYRRIKLDFSDI